MTDLHYVDGGFGAPLLVEFLGEHLRGRRRASANGGDKG